jgi:hypothetical protein
MKFVRSGLLEFLIFMVVISTLIAAHSSRLDKALVVVWAVLLIGGSARLILRGFALRNDPVAANRTMTGRWSSVPPPKILRWIYGQSDEPDSK